MPEFSRPWFLLLLVVPAWLAWARRRRPPAGVVLPSLSLIDAIPPRRWFLRTHGPFLLRLLGLTLAVVALAGPRRPDLRTRLDTEGIAVMMAVDVSGSMNEADFFYAGDAVSRLDAVKRVFRAFVEGGAAGESPDGTRVTLPGRGADRIGLVCFATTPELVCPLTLSHPTLVRLMEAQRPREQPGEQGTNVSDGVALGLSSLKAEPTRRRVLVLLTDGEHNVFPTQSGWTPRQSASVAASLGVTVYTIDAGPSASAMKEDAAKVREAASAVLDEMARMTGGRSFAAGDTASLVAACREIDRLERTAIRSPLFRRYFDYDGWLSLAAVACYAAAFVASRTVWRRVG